MHFLPFHHGVLAALGWAAGCVLAQVYLPAPPVPSSVIRQIAVGLVAPIHVALIPNSGKVVFLERINGGDVGTTHTQEFDPLTGQSRALNLLTDTFCSAGFISPDPYGKLFNVGGWDGPALEAIRHITPCGSPGLFGACDWQENAQKAALKVPRWYPSALPLATGRVAIFGGTTSATGLPVPAFNQPNVEVLPPYVGEVVIPIPLLVQTDQYNLYPIAHLLPNNQIFLLAGTRSQVLDSTTFQALYELPEIGQGKRTYPLAGSSVLLPLDPGRNYHAEVLVCGGGSDFNAAAPALDSCGRIAPLEAQANWVMETMPYPRLMPDMTILADGRILIINGAATGWGGFASASNPIFQSLIYDPNMPVGQRFTLEAISNIARMYHSESLLLEDGRVLITGSTPNANANVDPATVPYPNEVRIEAFYPSYLTRGLPRPTIIGQFANAWAYNAQVTVTATIPSGRAGTVTAALFTNGFVTHSTHQGQRYVKLVMRATLLQANRFTVTLLAPPTAAVLPPGWYMLFILDAGIPSVAVWVNVGGDPAGIGAWV